MKKSTILVTLCLLFSLAGSQVWAQNTGNTGGKAILTIAKEATAFSFGTVAEHGGPITHQFKVTNTGNAPLVINSVKASCGCTTPSWTKEAIQPGDTGVISATYNPLNRPGVFSKSITINTNADPSTFVFHITGTVDSKK